MEKAQLLALAGARFDGLRNVNRIGRKSNNRLKSADIRRDLVVLAICADKAGFDPACIQGQLCELRRV